MKMSQLLAPTLREVPSEAEIISHQLLLRAGFIRRVTPGVYNLYPLMWRVVRKVEQIVREEMDRIGSQELRMPILSPAELWMESGRWQAYGKEMFRLKNRHDRDELLGPTHEEVVTSIGREELRSYRQLPTTLYQIQVKFRDEIRPRFGLLRGREFVMKDAYSFHTDTDSLEVTYAEQCRAYTRIFERCGLHTRMVESDVGAIGGSAAHEFMVVVDTAGGENDLLFCDACNYAANVERAESLLVKATGEAPKALEKVSTPATKTIAQLSDFLKVTPSTIVKTLVYRVETMPEDPARADQTDLSFVAVLIRGDLEVNDVKLGNVLGALDLRLASDEELSARAGAGAGFVGPIGLQVDAVVADESVRDLTNFVLGPNETDMHFVNANWGRDYTPERWVDVRLAKPGETCSRCGKGHLSHAKGIEVGNTFKLGTKYSAKMGATFMDQDGSEKPFVMGCYGIGVTRTAQAAVEALHDTDGIKWPVAIAPYHLVVVPTNVKDESLMEVAQRLYHEAASKGLEVVLDDREERAGVKFKDADLIGFPVRLTVGKGVAEGKVEVKFRMEGTTEALAIDDSVERIRNYVHQAMAGHHRQPIGV
ncbi:proline--tRNA ligase [bacterium]|nr:proline--tRNA ligase [bacterium]